MSVLGTIFAASSNRDELKRTEAIANLNAADQLTDGEQNTIEGAGSFNVAPNADVERGTGSDFASEARPDAT